MRSVHPLRGLAIIAAAMAAPAAMATPFFSAINAAYPGEKNQAQILRDIYGGTFTVAGTHSFTNGAVTATRIADDGMGSPLNMLGAGFSAADDQAWAGPSATFIARAKYAGDRHAFGWIDSTSAEPTFQTILSNTATFNAPVTVTLSSQFVWALDNQRTGRLFTSDPADNLDRNETPRDQMVSYAVSGPGIAANTFLLFWEDRIPGDSMFDYDYNDAVIELTAVPTPGALALAGIGGLLVIRRKRR
jgi:MYXO-CTERM domain-containing protein